MKRIWGKRGIFTCTIASTLTSTIPGISEAGDTPELTLFTGPADAELLMAGKVLCMKDIPMNPELCVVWDPERQMSTEARAFIKSI